MTTTITTDFKAGMLAAMPGYLDQSQQLDTLREWLARKLGAVQQLPDDGLFTAGLAGQIAAAAASEKKQPPDLTAATTKHETERNVASRILAAHRAAVANAEQRLESLKVEGVGAAFGWLREQLADLYKEWTTLDFKTVTTAEQAVRAGRGDDFRRLDDFANRYLGLRSAHRQLLTVDARASALETGPLNLYLAVCGQMREHLTAEPYWCVQRRRAAATASKSGEQNREHAAWLAQVPAPFGDREEPSDNYLVPGRVTVIEWVDHVFRHDPWVCTASDLYGLFDLARVACSPGVKYLGPAAEYTPMAEEYVTGQEHAHSQERVTARDAHRTVTAKLP